MQLLQAPAVRDEPPSQPVQQLGVRRRTSQVTEIAGRLYQTATKRLASRGSEAQIAQQILQRHEKDLAALESLSRENAPVAQ